MLLCDRLFERTWIPAEFKNYCSIKDSIEIENIRDSYGMPILFSFIIITNSIIENRNAPVMLYLLMDCIHQLLIQNPTAFEFNQELLLYIIDEYFFGRFVIQIIQWFMLTFVFAFRFASVINLSHAELQQLGKVK